MALGAAESAGFATVEVAEPSREFATVVIEAFGITMRLEGESSARRIAEVVGQLRALR